MIGQLPDLVCVNKPAAWLSSWSQSPYSTADHRQKSLLWQFASSWPMY
jgi:hypothetical protein